MSDRAGEEAGDEPSGDLSAALAEAREARLAAGEAIEETREGQAAPLDLDRL